MARAYQFPDMSEPATEPQAGEWQALRGELVALLDQVEGHYAHEERGEPALSGLTRRVQSGFLYHYAFAMILGLIVLLAVLIRTLS